jgi:hypothetical protein
MTQVLNKYQFFLNSQQAEKRSDTNGVCEFNLKKKLTLSSPLYQFEISVNRINLPFSFYQFNSKNTTVPITVVSGVSTWNGSFQIDRGNYTLSSMIDAFNSILSTTLNTLTGGVINDFTLDYRYNQNSGKAQYRNTSPGNSPPVTYSITFGTCAISNSLGFRSPWTLTNGNPFLTATYTVNMNPVMNVYVTSDTFSDDSAFEAIGGTVDYSGVIAVIPIVHSPWYYQPVDFNVPIKIRISNNTLSVLDFNLVDSLNQEIELDQPWSMQFTIEEVLINPIETNIQTVQASPPNDIFQNMKDQILTEAQTNVSKRQRQSE